MTETAEFIVVGAGIAGASAAYALAPHGRVVLLERESQPGYHTTGRSAALFTETYGNPTIRAITKASRAFLTDPPDGFADHPILSPRGVLLIGRTDQAASLYTAFTEGRAVAPDVTQLSAEEARRIVPALRADYLAGAVYEPGSMDIDVHALHRGYLRAKTRHGPGRGGRLVTDAEVTAVAREGGGWRVETRAGAFAAPVLVNAAGAWVDAVAKLAGLAPIGLVPKRRTAFTFDVAADQGAERWPSVIDVDEEFYVKPEAGRLLGSPADETPSAPCDAQPEEIDLAVAVDRIERAFALEVKRLHSKWAGLRSFVADKTFVVGQRPDAPGFVWLAGQGGYGIQSSPAMGRIAAGMALGRGLPDDVMALGVGAAQLAPDRPALRVKGAA